MVASKKNYQEKNKTFPTETKHENPHTIKVPDKTQKKYLVKATDLTQTKGDQGY